MLFYQLPDYTYQLSSVALVSKIKEIYGLIDNGRGSGSTCWTREDMSFMYFFIIKKILSKNI